MDDFEVLFSSEILNRIEETAVMHLITATATEEQAKQIKLVVRAFTKRGVPARIVLDAILEIAKEGGIEDG